LGGGGGGEFRMDYSSQPTMINALKKLTVLRND